MKMMKRCTLLALLAALACCFCGCVHNAEATDSELPWSSPASWEGKQLGIPY